MHGGRRGERCALGRRKTPLINKHMKIAYVVDTFPRRSELFIQREIDDRMGKFRIEIGPLNSDEYREFFPGSEAYNRLVLLTELYLQDPLEYEIEVFMHKQQAQTVCLGSERWSKLGMDTWLYAGNEIGVTKNTFYPSDQGAAGMVQ